MQDVNKNGPPGQVLVSRVHRKERDERIGNGSLQGEDDRMKLLIDEWLIPALVTAFIQEKKIDRHLEVVPKRENNSKK